MSKRPNGVAVDVALHAKVKSAAPLRGTNLEGAYDEALRAWLDPAEPRYRSDRQLHKMLDDIIANGDPRDAAIVRQTLALYAGGLKAKK